MSHVGLYGRMMHSYVSATWKVAVDVIIHNFLSQFRSPVNYIMLTPKANRLHGMKFIAAPTSHKLGIVFRLDRVPSQHLN